MVWMNSVLNIPEALGMGGLPETLFTSIFAVFPILSQIGMDWLILNKRNDLDFFFLPLKLISLCYL